MDALAEASLSRARCRWFAGSKPARTAARLRHRAGRQRVVRPGSGLGNVWADARRPLRVLGQRGHHRREHVALAHVGTGVGVHRRPAGALGLLLPPPVGDLLDRGAAAEAARPARLLVPAAGRTLVGCDAAAAIRARSGHVAPGCGCGSGRGLHGAAHLPRFRPVQCARGAGDGLVAAWPVGFRAPHPDRGPAAPRSQPARLHAGSAQ